MSTGSVLSDWSASRMPAAARDRPVRDVPVRDHEVVRCALSICSATAPSSASSTCMKPVSLSSLLDILRIVEKSSRTRNSSFCRSRAWAIPLRPSSITDGGEKFNAHRDSGIRVRRGSSARHSALPNALNFRKLSGSSTDISAGPVATSNAVTCRRRRPWRKARAADPPGAADVDPACANERRLPGRQPPPVGFQIRCARGIAGPGIAPTVLRIASGHQKQRAQHSPSPAVMRP